MNKATEKNRKRAVRHNRIRATVSGTATRPRLAVFKSNRFMYAQLIDDTAHHTLAMVDSRKVAGDSPVARAATVGTEIAALAKKANVTEVVFDRGGFRYQGAVAALADAAREGGLKF